MNEENNTSPNIGYTPMDVYCIGCKNRKLVQDCMYNGDLKKIVTVCICEHQEACNDVYKYCTQSTQPELIEQMAYVRGFEQGRTQGMIDAQLKTIRINLNEPVKVKLTDLGKEIYYHQYDRINHIAGREICKPKFPKEDENGYTEFQLWCFMELYGEHMGMTLPNVIKPLEIVYERREVSK